MRHARFAFAPAVLLLAIAACSSSNDNSSDGGTTAAEACADQSNALCELRSSCSNGFAISHTYGTLAQCETRTAQVCVNGLDASGTGNTSAHVEGCAAAYPSEQCTDYYDGNPVAACVPPAGSLSNGSACGQSAQCSSTFCAVPQYQVCGTCQPLPVAGATCTTQASCGRDLACAIPTTAEADGGVATTGTCVAYAASGAACMTGMNPCAEGLACVGDDPSTEVSGTCQPQATTVGASCDSSRKTAVNCSAQLGLQCIPTAAGSSLGTCKAITLVGGGDTCGNLGSAPITGFADCSNGGLCKKSVSTDPSGVCVPTAADGAACDNDPANGPPCLAPAICVIPSGSSGTAGTCTIPNASNCH